MKKYLLTILYTIIISTFIFNTAYLCIIGIPGFLTYNIYTTNEFLSKEENYSTLNNLNEILQKSFQEERENHNDPNFPAEALISIKAGLMHEVSFVTVYFYTFVFSIALGNLIYFVVIKNNKGLKLVIPVIIVLISLIGICTGVSYSYGRLFIENFDNAFDSSLAEKLFEYYILGFVLIYVGNLIYRKYITNKLNKELNKK